VRVDVSPDRAVVSPGSPVSLTVAVTNTTDVISGHQVRVLGVDPRWVELSQERLSLFPGATATCVVTDRGPYGGNRIIDLDDGTFAQLAPLSAGVIDVVITW